MATENKVLMQQAREALSGKWGLAVLTFFVYSLVVSLASYVPLAIFFVGGPMSVGIAIFSLNLSREKNAQLEQIFNGFSRFSTAAGAYLLMMLYVLLWMLLFIIPGIIAAFAYSQTFFIIADDESVTASEALQRSKEMMNGNKLKLFFLGLRFFGWSLLCILTLGIGFFWLVPYMNISYAKFYDDISGHKEDPSLEDQIVLD